MSIEHAANQTVAVAAHIEYHAVANLIRRTKRLLEPGKVCPLSLRRDLVLPAPTAPGSSDQPHTTNGSHTRSQGPSRASQPTVAQEPAAAAGNARAYLPVLIFGVAMRGWALTHYFETWTLVAAVGETAR